MLVGCNFTQIVFFFLVYCVFGWVFESTYVSICEKKLTNRGFMRGPFIPIYGCGAMMLLFSASLLLAWPVAVFFAGMISCTVLEYVTGWGMEKIFKVRYWDYSHKPLNLNGHICLESSIVWGGMALLLNYVIHIPIRSLSSMIPYRVLSAITILVSVYFIVDLTLAFKVAFDIRSIIIKIEQAKQEMYLMSRRLDVILAVANDEVDKKKQAVSDTFENITDGIEERLSTLKSMIEAKPSEIAENVKAEYYELRAKVNLRRTEESLRTWAKDYYRRSIIKGNPSMKSIKFADAFETLRKGVLKKNEASNTKAIEETIETKE